MSAWRYLQATAKFYWDNRAELKFLATEYLQFLKEPGTRREIRVAADDHNESVGLEGDRWRADLPDCCVVCGEPADCDWNHEQRSLTDLTWPFLCPLLGLLAGVLAWIFMWSSEGRWLVLLGILGGNATAYFFKLPPVIPVDWILIGLAICSIVGVVFGSYPAFKAANLDPIESLRYE